MLAEFYHFLTSCLGALFAIFLVKNAPVFYRVFGRVKKLFAKVPEKKTEDQLVTVRIRSGSGEISYWEGKPGISRAEAFLVYVDKQKDTYSPLTSEGLVDPKEVWPGDVFRQTYREAKVARVTKTLPPQKPWARVEDYPVLQDNTTLSEGYVLSPEEREEREAEMAAIGQPQAE